MTNPRPLPISQDSVIQFAKLFAGRTDAWGRVGGACVKETVTSQHYARHLRGEQSLGVYCLRPDSRVHWACLDLDVKGQSPEFTPAEALALARAAAAHGHAQGCPAYVERSKSGGYHVWVFFSEPTPARTARQLLRGLWQHAAGEARSLPEIFPKQDSAQGVKYGNYVNLPYFGAADEARHILSPDGEPMPLEAFLDTVQWVDLAAVARIGGSESRQSSRRGQRKRGQKSSAPRPLLPCARLFVEQGVLDGARNRCMFTLAKHCRGAHMPQDQALRVCREANQKCLPPLPNSRVVGRIRSAYEGNGGAGYTSLGCDVECWQGRFCQPDDCPVARKRKASGQRRPGPAPEAPESVASDPDGDLVTQVDILRDCSDPAHLRNRRIGELVLSHLKRRGSFCRADGGDLHYLDDEIRRLHSVPGESFRALLHRSSGINPQDPLSKQVLAHINTFASVETGSARVAVLCHYADGVLLVSRFDGYAYRCDGTSITLVPNGTDGVVFLDQPQWQPYTLDGNATPGAFRQHLVAPGRFAPGTGCWLDPEEAALLYSAWVLSLLFRDLTPARPLLALIGTQGSGKTTTARLLLRWLLGETADVSALRRDKEDGFIAAVSHQPLVCFDNVDTRIPWLNDHLATLATGGVFPVRQLYTTNEHLQLRANCHAILTSRTPSFTRGDVAERLLVLRTERIANDQRRGDRELLEAVATERNAIWSDVLTIANRLVALRPELDRARGSEVRMADWGSFVLAAAALLGWDQVTANQALRKLARAQTSLTIAHDDTAGLLAAWMAIEGNCGRQVRAAQLHRELKDLAATQGVPWQVANAQALSQRLGSLWTALSELYGVHKHAHGNAKCYTFSAAEPDGSSTGQHPPRPP